MALTICLLKIFDILAIRLRFLGPWDHVIWFRVHDVTSQKITVEIFKIMRPQTLYRLFGGGILFCFGGWPVTFWLVIVVECYSLLSWNITHIVKKLLHKL